MRTKILTVALLGVAGLGAVSLHLPRGSSTAVVRGGAGRDARSLERWIQGVGRVEPESEVRRLVFRVNGIVDRCPVEVGETVQEGDVLMALEGEEQARAVALAEKEVELAKAERDKVLAGVNPFQIVAAEIHTELLNERLKHARIEYDRVLRMFTRSAASDSEKELARTEWAQHEAALRHAKAECQHLKNFVTAEDRQLAESKVRMAEARLALMRQRLRDTVLIAPCDGTVLEILRRKGDGVFPTDDEPAVIFGDLSRLRIRAEIDERYARDVKKGQRAVVFGRGLGQESLEGRVTEVRSIMGKRAMFSRAAAERKDLDVVQVLIELEDGSCADLDAIGRIDPHEQMISEVTKSTADIAHILLA